MGNLFYFRSIIKINVLVAIAFEALFGANGQNVSFFKNLSFRSFFIKLFLKCVFLLTFHPER